MAKRHKEDPLEGIRIPNQEGENPWQTIPKALQPSHVKCIDRLVCFPWRDSPCMFISIMHIQLLVLTLSWHNGVVLTMSN